jgi:hypothetical protein
VSEHRAFQLVSLYTTQACASHDHDPATVHMAPPPRRRSSNDEPRRVKRQLAVGQFTSAEGSTTAVLQSSTHGAEPTGSTESTGSTVVGGASGTSLGSASFETGIGSGIIVTPTINGAATSSTVGVGVGTSSSAASASSATTRLGGTTIAVSKAEPQSYVCE